MAGVLDELLGRIVGQPPKEKKKIAAEVRQATAHMMWLPNPGPQTQAYLSEADVLLYGGQAGGGKSHLELGLCINESDNSIIFRRELSQTDGLEKEAKTIIPGPPAVGFNGTDLEWTWPNGKSLKLGGMKDPDSWQAHAGRERQMMCFDEAFEFLENQVASIIAWLRAPEGKRTRVILASNPPRTAEGLWGLEWFAPWLDETSPLYPTPPGKLLWCVYVANENKGRTIWVEGPGEYEVDGETYTAKSRTFIPASLEDNPYRNNAKYRATLQNLPEPLRSQLLYGDFRAGLKDGANQTIPTAWIRAAQARWTKDPPPGIPQCALGVDAMGGGKDQMVIAPRYDAYYGALKKIPGKEIPMEKQGSHAAGLVLAERRNNSLIVIDMSGGYGGPMYSHLVENEIECMAYKGAGGTTRRTVDSKLAFTNIRSAAYWGMREDLDPDQPGGSHVALPPDPRLLAGLAAPTFEVTSHGVKVEPKSKREGGVKGVVERLGWSPDEADAVVMARWGGPRALTHGGEWAFSAEQGGKKGLTGMRPQVVMGHSQARRKR